MAERLTPCMQECDDPDLGTEMLGVGGDDAQRVARCLEQDVVDHSLVLQRDLGDR